MKRIFFVFIGMLTVLVLILLFGCDVSTEINEIRKEDFAERAAKSIVSNDLKSPSSAIWNEVSYLENNEKGQYVVYVDVEATNSFGGYIRNRFFVIISDINVKDKTYKYSSLFPYIECTGKNDSYNLMLIKAYNNYNKTDSSDNSEQNPENKIPSLTNYYELNYTAGEGGTIEGYANQTIQQGTSGFSVTAVPDEGYEFVRWSDGYEAKTRQERNVASDGEYQAIFQLIKYTLSTQINIQGAGNYTQHEGTLKTFKDVVTLEATENDGYTFLGWYIGDKLVSQDSSITFTMPTRDVMYTAKFRAYKLTTQSNIEGAGSFTQFTEAFKTAGKSIRLEASQNSGYTFVGWYEGENLISKKATVLLTMPASDVIYTATYYGYTYKLSKDRASYTVTGYQGKLTGAAVIPTEYNGKPVTQIGERAFLNCYGMKSVVIPNSITSIGKSAFCQCYALAEVVFEENSQLEGLGDTSFLSCALTSISIPDSVTSLGGAFEGCTKLTSVHFGTESKCQSLYGTFNGCSSLTSIILPNSVNHIGENTFKWCYALQTVTLSNNLDEIWDGAFENCINLASINYSGTISQWKGILKWSEWDRNTGDYIVYCSNGII